MALSLSPMSSIASSATALPWAGAVGRVMSLDNILDGDALLVERCLSGEEAAWEDLVKVHTKRVYSI